MEKLITLYEDPEKTIPLRPLTTMDGVIDNNNMTLNEKFDTVKGIKVVAAMPEVPDASILYLVTG